MNLQIIYLKDQICVLGLPFQKKIDELFHMIRDKKHIRTTGPYSEITQQPSKGKESLGGQRIGEMEVWAIEVFGAAYSLKEFLSYKSDDIFARQELKQAIQKNPSDLCLSYNTNLSETFKAWLYLLIENIIAESDTKPK